MPVDPALIAGGVGAVVVALLAAYGLGRVLRGRTPDYARGSTRSRSRGGPRGVGSGAVGGGVPVGGAAAGGGGYADADAALQRALHHHQGTARAIESGLYRLRSYYDDPNLVAELRRLEGMAAQLRSDLGRTMDHFDR